MTDPTPTTERPLTGRQIGARLLAAAVALGAGGTAVVVAIDLLRSALGA